MCNLIYVYIKYILCIDRYIVAYRSKIACKHFCNLADLILKTRGYFSKSIILAPFKSIKVTLCSILQQHHQSFTSFKCQCLPFLGVYTMNKFAINSLIHICCYTNHSQNVYIHVFVIFIAIGNLFSKITQQFKFCVLSSLKVWGE